MENSVMRKQAIVKYDIGEFLEVEDVVAIEAPLTIVINGEEFATMLCTPSHLEELVVGFLAAEGLIRTYKEIQKITIDEDKGFAYVKLEKVSLSTSDATTKRVVGSCCGKSRQFYFQSDVKTAKTVVKCSSISVEQCIKLMRKMQEGSDDYQRTGCLHNAALCTKDDIVISRSDIGRHNALDKIYGYCLMNGVGVRDKVIVFSGRISSEVLLKVSKIGIGILLSKSAPTTLAIELAEDLGITAVGFIRGQRLNVYSRSDRIICDKELKGD
ncbi:FdhD protein [Evansella vedderi]|uniref:Sulfur carrier protein FdhD n=1 Tax=Evansella vedderi TaxID=38282 RepID=A0ABU0A0C6_9BACI|nr:formate dehydrogenase accessory sulfurtransferase FdhD [Evansella vedderi]MDQ0256948.1 FdhD protein [Evansella vedderi]